MFSKLINWFKGRGKGTTQSTFPNKVMGFWYSYEWWHWQHSLYKGGAPAANADIAPFAVGRLAFNPFTTGLSRRDTSGLIDGLIPGMCVGNWVALYECSNRRPNGSGSDLAPWDDGRYVDLTFKYTLPINEVIDRLGLTGKHLTLLDDSNNVVDARLLGSVDQQPGD